MAKVPNLDWGMVKVSARLCSFLELENFFQATKPLSEVTFKLIVKKGVRVSWADGRDG